MHPCVLLTDVLDNNKNNRQQGALLLVQACLLHTKPTGSSLQGMHGDHSRNTIQWHYRMTAPQQDDSTTS